MPNALFVCQNLQGEKKMILSDNKKGAILTGIIMFFILTQLFSFFYEISFIVAPLFDLISTPNLIFYFLGIWILAKIIEYREDLILFPLAFSFIISGRLSKEEDEDANYDYGD